MRDDLPYGDPNLPGDMTASDLEPCPYRSPRIEESDEEIGDDEETRAAFEALFRKWDADAERRKRQREGAAA